MSPAPEPFAADIEKLGLPKQDVSNLSEEEEKLFFKDKKGNIFPYYKKDIYKFIDVRRPCTFFPILQALDIPFYEDRWLQLIELAVEHGYENELEKFMLGKYISWCKLFDIKDRGFKDSNKFFIDWMTGGDYYNFRYILKINPPVVRFGISYH